MDLTLDRPPLEREASTVERSLELARRPLEISRPAIERTVSVTALAAESGGTTDPYPDYSIELTVEGGILITYKTYDDRFPHGLGRFVLWCLATGAAAWLCLHASPVANMVVNIAALITAGALNL